jgi:hypothetical protein
VTVLSDKAFEENGKSRALINKIYALIQGSMLAQQVLTVFLLCEHTMRNPSYSEKNSHQKLVMLEP